MLIIRRIELYQYIIWYISLGVGDWYADPSGPVYQPVTYTLRYIPDDVLIQFDSPDDQHWVARNM